MKSHRQFAGEDRLLKMLIDFHEATMDAIFRQRRGHSDGWPKVMKLSEKIEDDFDLTACQEFLD